MDRICSTMSSANKKIQTNEEKRVWLHVEYCHGRLPGECFQWDNRCPFSAETDSGRQIIRRFSSDRIFCRGRDVSRFSFPKPRFLFAKEYKKHIFFWNNQIINVKCKPHKIMFRCWSMDIVCFHDACHTSVYVKFHLTSSLELYLVAELKQPTASRVVMVVQDRGLVVKLVSMPCKLRSDDWKYKIIKLTGYYKTR